MDPSFIHGPNVRTALRFVSNAELAGAFRAADLVVLPYREIDQSGVLFTAMAFGKPLLLTRVGGFPEIEGAELVAARRPRSARARADRPAERPGAAGADGRASERPEYGWDAIAHRTLELYAGAPGVDRVVQRGRVLLARRGPPLAGVEEAGALGDAHRERVVRRGSPARSSSQPFSCAAQSRSSATARVATPLPRASLATQ